MRVHKESTRVLDRIDLHILAILQDDGRIVMKDLAEQVGLSLTPCIERVKRMERDGEVDAWVMALPNGVCKPFVDAVDRGAAERKSEGSVIVDLGADYRFEEGWTYGLPGEAVSPSAV